MNIKIEYKQLESRMKGYIEKGYWGKVSLHTHAESRNPLVHADAAVGEQTKCRRKLKKQRIVQFK